MIALDLGIILVTHFIYDFLLQTRDIAKNKSSNMQYLLAHLFILTFGFMFSGLFIQGLDSKQWMLFILANMTLHGIIDWNIWSVYRLSVIKRFPQIDKDATFEYWEDHWFYSFIGLDQLLHGLCYIGIYFLLRG